MPGLTYSIVGYLYFFPLIDRPEYLARLDLIGIDMHADRWLLASLLVCSLVYRSTADIVLSPPGRRILISLLTYALIGSVAILGHSGDYPISVAVAEVMRFFTIMCISIMSWRKRLTFDADAVVTAVRNLSVMSGAVGMAQFAYDESLMRLGQANELIAGFPRTLGLLDTLEEQGLVLNIGLCTVLWGSGRTYSRLVQALILLGGTFCVQQRFAVVVAAVLCLWWISVQGFRRGKARVVGSSLAIVALFIGGWRSLPDNFRREYISERVVSTQNAVGRIAINRAAVDLIMMSPWGYGMLLQSSRYQEEAVRAGIPLYWNKRMEKHVPLVVHNGYLGSAVRYGVLGVLAFLAVFVAGFSWARAARHFAINEASMAVGILVSLALYNISQDGSFPMRGFQIVAVALGALVAGVSQIELNLHSRPARPAYTETESITFG